MRKIVYDLMIEEVPFNVTTNYDEAKAWEASNPKKTYKTRVVDIPEQLSDKEKEWRRKNIEKKNALRKAKMALS